MARRLKQAAFGCVGALCLVVAFSVNLHAQSHFIRGDANDDGAVNISDAQFTLNSLFLGGPASPCSDAADVNDDGEVNISDASATINFLFLGGVTPSSPYPGVEGDPTDDALGCKPTIVDHSGSISADETWARNVTHRLVSAVTVEEGATLTIEPGTTIIGDSATQGLLVVDRGGQLMAVGSATRPIIFTSERPVGQRGRGDWGGLILLGRGDNNVVGKEALAEGLENKFWGGGANVIPDDSSGRLSYVRIEYGGTEISVDNEVNSLSMFGCGSGTQFDHIQTKYNLDDGFEWFGGAADLKYGIATGIGDDCFDYSFGWAGRGQFWVAQQRGDDADNGFEVDNHEEEFENLPLVKPVLSNVTLVGDPDADEGDESDVGLQIRRGAGTVLYNTIVQGFKDCALDIDDAPTFKNNPTNGNFIIDYSTFADIEPMFCDGDDGDPLPDPHFTAEEFFTVMNSNNTVSASSILTDPYVIGTTAGVGPNFRPLAGTAASTFDPTTLGSFFEPGSYQGAINPDPGAADWTKAPWVSQFPN